ncbi:hypothetical protein phiAS5_ORF0056 [Aeromonas phage phiAS5]|uniref:Uncharacterized protein n=1 Tax=Aeromonas phage phiAS5 TaxID=879630 RepID=E1A2F3_9CAUD|nr:hypothetical protein phiAS5_ORF0056 [Aeromonas phage phiAS5]ADM79899.1 hypothetical protein phiAS5_ORF0056 [Aeromonas phage phiAS5]BES53331.1 hypothetical protein [Aeromonas phage phiWae14]
MAKKSQRGKGHFAIYKATGLFAKNKERDLKRHVAVHGDDSVAVAALKAVPAKSSRWGYTGPENPKKGAKDSRLDVALARAVRKAERVYKFVKDKDAVVLGRQNRIVDAETQRTEFKFKRHAPRPEAAPVKAKKPVRRGK